MIEPGGPLQVLVTRPGLAGEALCALIIKQGDNATYFPTIVFKPPLDLEAMQQGIQQIAEQDWLIFISPQSVYASVPAIRHAWPHLPESVHMAAIGEGTASALKEAGYDATLKPAGDWNSEGLLAAPALQTLAGKKVAIIRGEGGREKLDKMLRTRGAEVTPIVAYQRALPSVDVTPCLSQLQKQDIHAVICTSYEGVSNLKTLVGEVGWQALSRVPLLIPSERIKILAEDLGFQTIWVAANASNEAMIAELKQIKRRRIRCYD